MRLFFLEPPVKGCQQQDIRQKGNSEEEIGDRVLRGIYKKTR